MKFGHEYKNFLEQGGFPSDWVESAISYQKLKKCIKRVRLELAAIGLDPETLRTLIDHAEAKDEETNNERPLRYEFERKEGRPGHTRSASGPIQPKLLFLIDEATGEPVNAQLSPETKRYVHELALAERLTTVQLDDAPDHSSVVSAGSNRSSIAETVSSAGSAAKVSPKATHKLIEVPLASDSEFFGLLQTELSGLAHLQDSEQHKIQGEISGVGDSLAKVVDPSTKSGRADLDQWRRIFELYMDTSVFFNIGERNHGVQQFSAAQERYNKFLSNAQKANLLRKFKRKESMNALQHFLRINVELLQNLRFQEINQTAMIKILKKFDKRTSLNVKSIFPKATPVTPISLSKSLSQSLSQEITTRILSIIPSLDDYLCPICSDLAWRPIRLRCKHIFCIRCLIRLQREKKDRCPLCRENVVMQADSSSLDTGLIEYMKLWFPAEVKAKQRTNEKIALEEQFSKTLSNAQYLGLLPRREKRSMATRLHFFFHGVEHPDESSPSMWQRPERPERPS
ncbi:uncharacterized protein PV09_05915 [Verruconis gallopava]|uniref:RING-type domain-containing protein n=1 Tax=Verruconis gallopava TaxID=253628 RepID=A0A0D1YQH7_9PEZI|nr:uncharacterized protein PV09_05915 [Verruconis gallopava]KIW02862.1 hypothetical protein PV09_05915 [Verruconis gallopava]